MLPQHRAISSKGRFQDKPPSRITFEEEMNSSIVASASDTPAAHNQMSLLRSPHVLWQRLSRAPLLQFIALGALIFTVDHLVQSERTASQRQIVVDAQLRHRLQLINQTQSGFTPGPQQLERLVEDYIDDEVMYREALRLGLEQDDEIIRRRLIQKMQFLQRDLATAPKPGENELRAYYSAHPELFTTPMSVTFEQLYFSADHGGWRRAERRARHALDQVQQLPVSSAASPDDPYPLQIASEELTRMDAGRIFGDTPIVNALFSTPEGQWSEPVRSAYGWHLIKVSHRRFAGMAPFSQVRGQVESAFLQEQTQLAQRRELAALRARYDIVRPSTVGGGS